LSFSSRAIHRAQGGGEQQGARDEDERARSSVAQHDAAEHPGRGHHRAYGEVDPRRGDHERHPHGEHPDDTRLGEHVSDVVPGREGVGLEYRPGNEQQDDHNGERVLLELEPLEPVDELRGASR
jgi:hypothetical protein